MSNSQKNILVRNTQDNREASMSTEQFELFKKDPSNYFWINAGFEIPTEVLPCWYVDEQERIAAIKGQRLFCEHYITSGYFKIIRQLDTNFIEGFLGKKEDSLLYHQDFNRSITYFVDYLARKKVYFTFDKITLYQLMEIIPQKPFHFILKRIDKQKAFKKNQSFMIMPFHNVELDKFYFESLRPFLKNNLNIDIYRADDFRDNDIIVQTIYNLIEESEFIIADTTHNNKNSFYELGYASALGKEIITIQNKEAEQKLFFDRAHIRTIMYDLSDINTFQFDLESTIKSIRDRQ